MQQTHNLDESIQEQTHDGMHRKVLEGESNKESSMFEDTQAWQRQSGYLQ